MVVHNPESNMNNAVGVADVPAMLRGGMTVCLGNDGFSNDMFSEMKTAYKWMFALAFVCIGLEFNIMALREMGWRPMLVYLSATVFNTVLALIVAYIIFGVLFPG